jgi:hypothetical protein
MGAFLDPLGEYGFLPGNQLFQALIGIGLGLLFIYVILVGAAPLSQCGKCSQPVGFLC